jgi:hypothetical protein
MGGSHHNRWCWIGNEHVSTKFSHCKFFPMLTVVGMLDMPVFVMTFVLICLIFLLLPECDCFYYFYFVSEWAINIDNIKVSWLQLRNSFTLDGWVEAWVINAFCRMLFRKKHPRFSLKHFFFNTVSVSIFQTAFSF